MHVYMYVIYLYIKSESNIGMNCQSDTKNANKIIMITI